MKLQKNVSYRTIRVVDDSDGTIQMKATELFFPNVQLTILYEVALTFALEGDQA